MTATALGWIEPDWPAPAHVRVLSTLRGGGVSEGPYASLNLAGHVGDRTDAVAANRLLLREAARLPAEPLWLEQVHGTAVELHASSADTPPRADAAVAFEPGRVCAVMTADCLPVVFADRAGTRIGVAHAGWRGLVGGVLQATIVALEVPPVTVSVMVAAAAVFYVGERSRGPAESETQKPPQSDKLSQVAKADAGRAVLLLVILFPQLALWLPRQLGY